MASGKITNKNTISGSISSGNSLNASVTAGSGTTDHNRLTNRTLKDQHPVEAITGLREELDSKLDSKTALPLIEEAVQNKAKGLYFDAKKELAKKSYWYLTSEIDPVTKLGTKDSIISGPYDLGAGGGSGGGGGVTTVSVKPFEWPSTVVVGGEAKAIINWSSTIGENKEPTGDGTLYLTVNNKQVLVLPNQKQGLIELNLSPYLIAGNNNVQIKILDAYGTTGILVRTIAAVTLELKSNFNSSLNYTGVINYTYVPYGDLEKEVTIMVDGKKYGTQIVKSTGESQTFSIKNLTHGSHKVEVYFTANINGETVKSNTLVYDLVYYVPGNSTPIIVSTFTDLEQEQYISFNIPYRIYVDGKNEYEVSFLVNGDEINKTTIDTSEQYWNYLNDTPGNYALTIKCGTTTKTFEIHINKSTINVTPVDQDLALALGVQGRNNNEEATTRSQWIDTANNIECELTNFNWKSNGWMTDNNGNSILRVSGDARIKIPFQAFKEDFKNRGKTIELEIATSAVRNYSTTLISCLDKQSTDFYDTSASFTEEDFRRYTFKVNLDTSKLSITDPETKETKSKLTPGNHVFSYTANGWYLDNEVQVDIADYGISISKNEINPEGTHEDEFLLVGDNIIIEYTLAARGFYVTPQVAVFRSQQSVISTQYKEEEQVRITFVIERNTENRIIWMYINGIASGAMQYPIDDNFRQLDSNIIEIGSSDAVLDIYNIRVYDNSLTSKQVVNNWIADTQNVVLRAARYARNDNYNDKNELVISKLPTGLPYIIWDIDTLPEYKGDKRPGNAYYVDPKDSSRNFTAEVAEYNVQGTSSSVYPTKNIRLRMRKKNGEGYAWYDDNGNSLDFDFGGKGFAITHPNGIGANYFTFKVDYASSEGANNVELTKLYNDAAKACGIYAPPQRLNSKIRIGIDGFPIVAFHRGEDDKDVFCTKANFNNDKANEDVYGFEDGDESWETTNNSANEAKYKIPVTEKTFSNGFEIRFPDKDGYSDMSKLGPMTAWVASTNRDAATNEEFENPITYTYDETIVGEDGGQQTVEREVTFTHDTPEYRLTKFKVELKDWFNVDSTLFYYVFTHLFLMIDSRAKNAFPTYFKSRQAGDGGDRWFWIPYDMDTALGINNMGELVFDYNLEDTDYLDGSAIFNGQDSVMWCNVRDGMAGEVAAMYAKMRLSGLISFEEVENRFEAHQGQWSENIFNEDAKNKYVMPLLKGDNYLEMLQGSKAQQRKWWLYNRFKYMDSKYNAGESIKDFIQFRAQVEAGEEKPNITIIPYADIYATVSYANGRVVSKRAKRNEQIVIENPFTINETETEQETYIYSASQLKSVGDLSGFKPRTVKIGNAVKLQELKVGDKDPNYQNPQLQELTTGANILLRSIDARNCINLGTGATTAPDLRQCVNIEEIYFTGTQIKGIVLPDGGNIKKLHLPETLTSLTIRNQPLLNELVLAGTSNIESLWLENIPSTSIKSETMVSQMRDNTTVRLIGINENYNTYEEIKHFYDLLDTKKGLTADGETVEKAQVTGTITIDTISYANYMTLIARYPEVKINANQIICTVIFKNESQEHQIINVPLGNTIITPETPIKSSTQAHYYVFENWKYSNSSEIWTEEIPIVADTTFEAIYSEHLQQYTITFNPNSDIIKTIPENVTVEYGSTVETPILVDIPEGVELTGWYTADGSAWIFSPDEFATPVLDNIVIYASWKDYNTPTIESLVPSNWNTFRYRANDNLGIVAWTVVKNSTEAPTDWISITPTTNLVGTYTILDAGEYYFWIKDSNNNSTSKSIKAYEINTHLVPGIENYELKDDKQNNISTFALANTNITLKATLNSNYHDLSLLINNQLIDNQSPEEIQTSFFVTQTTNIEFECTPNDYDLSFELGGKGDPALAESQVVTYLTKATKPFEQYNFNSREVIEGWYLEPEYINEWNFNTDVILQPTVLYAKWVAYNDPTKLTMKLPKGDILVTLKYSQQGTEPVRIDWGDNKTETSDDFSNVITLNHIYQNSEEKEYIISIYGPTASNATYTLGGGHFDHPLVAPVNYLTNVEFSWDLAGANPGGSGFKGNTIQGYAFYRANIEKINLTPYMKSISTGCFAGCAKVTSLEIPENITTIYSQAFSGCSGLTGKITLHSKLTSIGSNAFDNCININEVELLTDSTICTYGSQVFRYCDNLDALTFSDTFTLIPYGMFVGCNKLTKVVLPETIDTIQANAFMDCQGLTHFATHAVYIGDSAFLNCSNLDKVLLTNKNLNLNVDFPGSYIFDKCSKLNSAGPLVGVANINADYDYDINFAWDTEIPAYALNRGYYDGTQGFLSKTENSLNEVVLPTTLETIGKSAFSNSYFNKINLMSTKLKTIGELAFDGSSLSTLEIPQSVIDIKPRAFAVCNFLSSAIIRALSSETKVTSPENAWFIGCTTGLDLRIPAAINTSVSNVETAYGKYWDAQNSAGTKSFGWSSINENNN